MHWRVVKWVPVASTDWQITGSFEASTSTVDAVAAGGVCEGGGSHGEEAAGAAWARAAPTSMATSDIGILLAPRQTVAEWRPRSHSRLSRTTRRTVSGPAAREEGNPEVQALA